MSELTAHTKALLPVQVQAQLPVWAHTSTVPVAKRAGAAATAAALWASLALGAGAADLSAGEEVFTNNCAACHTGGANVVQAEKTLQKDALVQYLDGGFKVESIVTQVSACMGATAIPFWAQHAQIHLLLAAGECADYLGWAWQHALLSP